jgi:parallel beta-helix repeat protein
MGLDWSPPMMRILALLLFLTLATPALASDGVLEINQTCAVNTGCFAGDTAGFPVTISASGSYRLTSNLNVPNEETSGIVVGPSSVSIDLNGFEIAGPVTCSGSPLICTPDPVRGGSGVEQLTASTRGISVKNGIITGMGYCGVLLWDQAEVTNVRARWNGFYGIGTAAGSTVSGNTAYQNGANGIGAGPGSTVSGNASYQNRFNGIYTDSGSTVSVNTAYGNGSDGIVVTSGSTVQRNTVRGNISFGLSLGSQSTYRENTVTNNTGGSVNGGVNMGDNSCNGTTTCP